MEETKALGPIIGYCGNLVRARMDARLAQFDSTLAQSRTLLYLYRHGGQAPQYERTEYLKVKPSTAGGILDRMEEKGLVRRSVHGADARCRLITLTEKGRNQQEQFHQGFLDTERAMLRGFTPEEMDLLRDFLRRITTNLEEDFVA